MTTQRAPVGAKNENVDRTAVMIIIRKDGLKTFEKALSKSFFKARATSKSVEVMKLRSSNGRGQQPGAGLECQSVTPLV